MKSVRCPRCGLVSFDTATTCKGCNANSPNDLSTDFFQPYSAATRRRPLAPKGSTSKITAVLFLLLVGALVGGAVLFRARLVQALGGSTGYAELVRHSAQFNSPVWVRANQQEIPIRHSISERDSTPMYINSGLVVYEVEVLASLGFLQVDKYDTEEFGPPDEFIGRSKYRVTHYRINLTSMGQEAANHWETVHEPLVHGGSEPMNEPLAWWRVPIGKREFQEVTKVGSIEHEEGKDRLDVEFSYHWRPNDIGLSFDKGNRAPDAIPQTVRRAADYVPWDSRKTYVAVAHLERIAGQWKLADITFSSEERIHEALTIS